jgi:ABC-type uncharacterized transport system permease subunit
MAAREFPRWRGGLFFVPYILGYGLLVAAVTAVLVRLLRRWAAWKIVTASIVVSDLIVLAAGVIAAFLAAASAPESATEPSWPYPPEMFEPPAVIRLALFVYCAAMIIAIPAAIWVSWVAIPRERKWPSEPAQADRSPEE